MDSPFLQELSSCFCLGKEPAGLTIHHLWTSSGKSTFSLVHTGEMLPSKRLSNQAVSLDSMAHRWQAQLFTKSPSLLRRCMPA